MFPVLFAIILPFYPDLNSDCIIIERSFGQDINKLTGVSYLLRDILSFADSIAINQLWDFAIKVSKKCHKQAISEKFSTRMEFLKILILLENSIANVVEFKWINDKKLLDFSKNFYEFDNFNEILDETEKIDIKQTSKKYQNRLRKYLRFCL